MNLNPIDTKRYQKSANPKALPPGDRDFIAAPLGRGEERYAAKQRQLYIAAYISETGSVSASYAYGPFGETIARTGLDFEHSKIFGGKG